MEEEEGRRTASAGKAKSLVAGGREVDE